MERAKSRREEYSEATRQALIDSATTLFADGGYSGTSLDDIAANARVTKGALYHHFAGKQALLEAVIDQLEQGIVDTTASAMEAVPDAWQATIVALDAFLDRCCDPAYSRIVMQEGPVALGFQRWRECEEKYAYGLVEAILRSLIDGGHIEPLPLQVTSRLAFGMLGAAALAIAEADDASKHDVMDESRTVVLRFLYGLRPAP